jgi:hypothetical protein
MPSQPETKNFPQLAKYALIMRFLGVIYALGALAFFFFPQQLFYLINVGPKVFSVTEAIPDSVERFWLVLATSMMAMLSALSFLSAESPGTRGYALVHLLSKVVSSVGFIYVFLNDKTYFAYLLGIVTDLSIALVLVWSMVRISGELRMLARGELGPAANLQGAESDPGTGA